MKEEMVSEYPMRINKYLARQGIATRRDADELITRERVLINGRIAGLGDKVLETDSVEVRPSKRSTKEGVQGLKKNYYFAYNKPRGITTPQRGSDTEDDESDMQNLPEEVASLGLFPVGRLDKGSHGLMILTNDGRITDRLLNPEKAHEKEYVVKTKLPLRDSFRKHMEEGVDIEGYLTKPAKVELRGDTSFAITLTEGKKHQIRRMVVAMHNEVLDLKRSRILNIKLGTLKAGELRPIEGKELETFLQSLALAAG
ncbi:MAG: rsuA [Parcubacteria group bacterium]|nr:rsuA [Parcubacteria group bacterium]